MGSIANTKESRAVQDFILKSKKAFAEKFERNKVNTIDISECVPDKTYTAAVRYAVVGSVETTSPTGKLKTYMYRASVDVNGKVCGMASLEILPIEE